MYLLDFVAFGVNQSPQKDKDEFSRQYLWKVDSPISDDTQTINWFFYLSKTDEEIQGKYQCPLGLECLLNKNQKDECEPYKADHEPNSE